MNDQATITVDRERDDCCELRLGGEISAYHARSLHLAALEVAETDKGAVVDCSAIRSLDYSALQILLALKQTLAVRHLPFDLAGASPELATTLALVGLNAPAEAGPQGESARSPSDAGV